MDDNTKQNPVETDEGYDEEYYDNSTVVPTVKVKKSHQAWLFALVVLAWCSGVAFFVLKTWFMVEGEFGPEKHPFQFPALQVHGFIAFLMMITYGYFLGTHVQHSWNLKPKRILGFILVAFPAFQMITSYLLYYVNWEDESREIIEYLHLGVGFVLPLILILHVFLPRILIKRRAKRMQRVDWADNLATNKEAYKEA
tara:strand:- start:370 stop:960 length:591 start_codon:yes stop_codon:yes gene_type:complete